MKEGVYKFTTLKECWGVILKLFTITFIMFKIT